MLTRVLDRRQQLAMAGALLGSLLTFITPAYAAPPTLRGIDMGTVLMMRDQARAGAARLNPDAQRDARKLEHIQTIVIDPGHGGENQGAIGTAHVHEKFLTLDLAFALRDALQERYPHARIVLTRYWDCDLDLQERITLANEQGADLFLSLHYNAAVHDKAVGVETYFLSTEQAIPGQAPAQSEPIASVRPTTTGMPEKPDAAQSADTQGTYNDAMLTLQRDLERTTQHQRSGMFAELVQEQLVAHTHALNRGVKQANFGVLRGALMPAIVVEAGFVTHPVEGKHVLRDAHREHVVEALITAIEAFDHSLSAQETR